MRPDAVGDAMAKRYGVSKSDFLDPDSSASMAVRLAKGESHIIQQSTSWLAEHGVSLEALRRAIDTSERRASVAGGSVQRSKVRVRVRDRFLDEEEGSST